MNHLKEWIVRLLLRINHSRVWHCPVRVHGSRYYPPTADRLLALWLHRLGIIGSSERAALSRYVRPGMSVADVGANQGLYTVVFSRLVGGDGSVFAFEPEPILFRALERNCAANGAGNVRTFNLALGDEDRIAVLCRSPLNSGDNRLRSSGGASAPLQVGVPMRRLDGLLGGERLDFVKLDVQGYELAVFRGMERVLSSNPQLRVYFELWPHGLRQAGSRPGDVVDFLLERGFRIMEAASGSEWERSDVSRLLSRIRGKAYTNLVALRA